MNYSYDFSLLHTYKLNKRSSQHATQRPANTICLVNQPDNDKEAGHLNRTISMTSKKDQGKILENIATMLFVGTEVNVNL